MKINPINLKVMLQKVKEKVVDICKANVNILSKLEEKNIINILPR